MRIDIRRAREVGQQVENGTFTGDYETYSLSWGRLFHSNCGTRSRPNPLFQEDHRLARIMWNKVGELFPAKAPVKVPEKSVAVTVTEVAIKTIANMTTTEIIAVINDLEVDWEAFERNFHNLVNAKLCSNPLSKV